MPNSGLNACPDGITKCDYHTNQSKVWFLPKYEVLCCCMWFYLTAWYVFFCCRRLQLWIWLTQVLCSVWLWWGPKLWSDTHSSCTSGFSEVPYTGLYIAKYWKRIFISHMLRIHSALTWQKIILEDINGSTVIFSNTRNSLPKKMYIAFGSNYRLRMNLVWRQYVTSVGYLSWSCWYLF